MKSTVIQIITAAIGTLGFSIYFRVSEKNVVASTIGGALGWAVYLIFDKSFGILFLSNFIATIFVYVYSQAAARILKAPANIFLVTGIIPLLPGNALYYMMFGLVNADSKMFSSYGKNTAVIAFGIAAGIVAAAVGINHFTKIFTEKRQNK